MKKSILFILTAFAVISFAQTTSPVFSWGVYNLQSYSGFFSLEGLYRNQISVLSNGTTEKPVTQDFSARIFLNTQSYVWHPNFMGINFDLDYNPGVKNETFLVTPNRSETRTAENMRLMLQFFKQRPLSFNYFINYSHNFTNREYTSNVETISRDHGVNLSFRNKILPVTINYLNSAWDQLELRTSRRYINLRESLQGNFNKSFNAGDRHELQISYEDYRRKYADADTVSNFVNNIRLQNFIPFGNKKTSNLRSLINFHDQQGNQPYRRLQINENLLYQLPYNFTVSGNYRYSDFQDLYQNNLQHNLIGTLKHQLFASLKTAVFFEFIRVANTAYDEKIRQGGLSLDYRKNVGIGVLNIGYNYKRRNDDRTGGKNTLIITREEKTLRDGETTLLDYPYVDITSVVVRDETGTIIYDENIDYILIERDDYVEIQRLPGGQILNGQTVYIDYRVLQPISYTYNTNNHGFSTQLNLFDRMFQIYYRYYNQSYSNIRLVDPSILKTVNQNVFGIRFKKYVFTLGAEYDRYNTNIVPYNTDRYFLVISDKINILYYILNFSYMDRYLVADLENQRFFDLSGQINIRVRRTGKISFYVGYRNQEGRGIDLDLRNFKIEYKDRYRSLYLSAGIEIYRREYLTESISYNGIFVRAERRF